MMEKAERAVVKRVLFIDKDLYAVLKRMAEDEERSVAAEIRIALRRHTRAFLEREAREKAQG